MLLVDWSPFAWLSCLPCHKRSGRPFVWQSDLLIAWWSGLPTCLMKWSRFGWLSDLPFNWRSGIPFHWLSVIPYHWRRGLLSFAVEWHHCYQWNGLTFAWRSGLHCHQWSCFHSHLAKWPPVFFGGVPSSLLGETKSPLPLCYKYIVWYIVLTLVNKTNTDKW